MDNEENVDVQGEVNTETTANENKTLSFDDMLAQNKDYQSEFDRKVAKALSTAKQKWESMTDEKLSEAEKLSKMSSDEKKQYLMKKREEALLQREQELTRKELMTAAKAQLSEAGVSTELAELLDYKDAESCKKSIEKLTKLFNESVEKSVENKLKGSGTMSKAQGDNLTTEAEKILNIMRNAQEGVINGN